MDKEDDIRLHAEKLLHYNNLLIEQCKSWLPAEEGNKRMMEKALRRRRNKLKMKRMDMR